MKRNQINLHVRWKAGLFGQVIFILLAGLILAACSGSTNEPASEPPIVNTDESVQADALPVEDSGAPVVESEVVESEDKDTADHDTTHVSEVAEEVITGQALEVAFQSLDNNSLASLSLDLTGLAPAPAGKTYTVWLINDLGQNIMIGAATPGQSFTYNDPNGENLVGKTIGAMLSLEATANVDARALAAPTDLQYAGLISPAVVPLVRLLVVRAPDTPAGIAYDTGLVAQAAIAAAHGQLALDAIARGDLSTGQLHVEHVWNVLSGESSPDFGDLNGDGRVENPGDGYGVWPYAFKVAEIADQVAEIPGLDDYLRETAVQMGLCARNISERYGPQAQEQGRAILAASTAAGAEPAALAIVAALDPLAVGVDANDNGVIEAVQEECGARQIYQLSHNLFHIHLTPQTELPTLALPSPTPVVITRAGDIDQVQAAIDEYKQLLGGQDNGGSPDSPGSGFRTINWDGIPHEFAAPNFMPADFFNAATAPRARGAVFTTPGEGVQVSASSGNPTGTAVRFGHINPTYSDIFPAFSEERLFSPVGSNIVDMFFFVPGTDIPAVVTGFGAVYVDVDTAHTAFEYFDAAGNLLGVYETPINDKGFSFLGVVFPTPVVYHVRISYGTSALGPDDGNGSDVAVMDDFIYGEPVALPNR